MKQGIFFYTFCACKWSKTFRVTSFTRIKYDFKIPLLIFSNFFIIGKVLVKYDSRPVTYWLDVWNKSIQTFNWLYLLRRDTRDILANDFLSKYESLADLILSSK